MPRFKNFIKISNELANINSLWQCPTRALSNEMSHVDHWPFFGRNDRCPLLATSSYYYILSLAEIALKDSLSIFWWSRRITFGTPFIMCLYHLCKHKLTVFVKLILGHSWFFTLDSFLALHVWSSLYKTQLRLFASSSCRTTISFARIAWSATASCCRQAAIDRRQNRHHEIPLDRSTTSQCCCW